MAGSIMIHRIVSIKKRVSYDTRKDGSTYKVIKLMATDRKGYETEFYMFCEDGVEIQDEEIENGK